MCVLALFPTPSQTRLAVTTVLPPFAELDLNGDDVISLGEYRAWNRSSKRNAAEVSRERAKFHANFSQFASLDIHRLHSASDYDSVAPMSASFEEKTPTELPTEASTPERQLSGPNKNLR
ncbi:hypothetical protein CYMTET_35088 [Cymbomonas tetramitiformis]|uniref:EF-hand domain-containing protein n=1 Tax=Cymbomonas tetramitiformis TaxID=36881 RepID=A0AAE0F9T8_9CHLO|nr:hypothetical protein CYMTET_35088 [Cymbomonas tetramitiformis]